MSAAPCEISSATIDRWRVSAALSGWSTCAWADSEAGVDAGHVTLASDSITVAGDPYTYAMDGPGPFDDTIFTDFGACNAGPLLSGAGKESRGHHAIQVGDKVSEARRGEVAAGWTGEHTWFSPVAQQKNVKPTIVQPGATQPEKPRINKTIFEVILRLRDLVQWMKRDLE